MSCGYIHTPATLNSTGLPSKATTKIHILFVFAYSLYPPFWLLLSRSLGAVSRAVPEVVASFVVVARVPCAVCPHPSSRWSGELFLSPA